MKDNCFTEFCAFLSYVNRNKPQFTSGTQSCSTLCNPVNCSHSYLYPNSTPFCGVRHAFLPGFVYFQLLLHKLQYVGFFEIWLPQILFGIKWERMWTFIKLLTHSFTYTYCESHWMSACYRSGDTSMSGVQTLYLPSRSVLLNVSLNHYSSVMW